MKTLLKLVVIGTFLLSFSCRDTKKEDAETEAMIEQIEAVESDIDSISEDVDAKAKALEAALKELDSI